MLVQAREGGQVLALLQPDLTELTGVSSESALSGSRFFQEDCGTRTAVGMSIILSAAATVPTGYGQRFKAVGNGGLPTFQNAGKASSRWVGKLPAVRAGLSASDSEESRNEAVPKVHLLLGP
ncbi:hypothetical protein R1sor_012136 [Riccia sorocarpa]|uniref:Uncharacterized protein n=1 Tax=Riccia sorocarpa TaxID=122646 RepID=A0ABD3I6R7_9MARC